MKNIFDFARLDQYMEAAVMAGKPCNFGLVFEAVEEGAELVTVSRRPVNCDSQLDMTAPTISRTLTMIPMLLEKEAVDTALAQLFASNENPSKEDVDKATSAAIEAAANEMYAVVYTNKSLCDTARKLYELAGSLCGAVQKNKDGEELAKSILAREIAQENGLLELVTGAPVDQRAAIITQAMPQLYTDYMIAWNEAMAAEDDEYTEFYPNVSEEDVIALTDMLVRRKFKFMTLKMPKKETLAKLSGKTAGERKYWENVNKVKEAFAKLISVRSSDAFKGIDNTNTEWVVEEGFEDL